MKKLILILLFLPFWIFGQTGIVLTPDIDASHLGGFLPAYYLDTYVGSYYNFKTDNYIEITDNDNLDFGTGDFSQTIRFYLNTVSGTQYLQNKEAGGVGYGIYITDDDILIRFDDNNADASAIILTAKIVVDTWYILSIAFDRDGNATANLNGTITGTVDISGTNLTLSNAGNYRLGSTTAGADFFDGYIDFNLLWNRLLTSSELKEISMWSSDIPPVWFSDVGASQTEQTSGTLTIGKRYRINDWITNDDFTNIGGTNVDGNEFIATGTTPDVWTNSSIVVQIGVVANYNGSGIGHNTWMDASGNDLYGTVSGATYTNIPASDIEEARQDGITGDTQILSSSNLVPDGYVLKYVIGTEVAGNTATLDLGTSAGGSQVFSQQVFTASIVTPVAVDFFNLTGSDVALYINDNGIGTWNSGELDFIFVIQKIR